MPSQLLRPAFIETLHDKIIHGVLPGSDAHFRMAHAVRRAEVVISPESKKDAAVLIPIFEKENGGLHIVFIRRTSGHNDKHAGQIGFPGGKFEQGDKDLLYTAMREASEEIAVDLSRLDILGPLTPLYITVSKFLVHPYVGYFAAPPVLQRQETEIEEILEIPLAALQAKEARQLTQIRLASGITLNHVPCFQIDNHIIWGATAMMLQELLEIID